MGPQWGPQDPSDKDPDGTHVHAQTYVPFLIEYTGLNPFLCNDLNQYGLQLQPEACYPRTRFTCRSVYTLTRYTNTHILVSNDGTYMPTHAQVYILSACIPMRMQHDRQTMLESSVPLH